jgi:hypothetical protein
MTNGIKLRVDLKDTAFNISLENAPIVFRLSTEVPKNNADILPLTYSHQGFGSG